MRIRRSEYRKIIKSIARRNIQPKKRRNLMLVIAIPLASFLYVFQG